MKNRSINNIKTIRKGKKHEHLTIDELTLIYRNDPKLDRRLKQYKLFINRYPNVGILEGELNNNFNSVAGNYLQWYIFRLVELGRIEIKIEVLIKLRIYPNDYRINVNKYISGEEINSFENYAIHTLKYKEKTIFSQVTPALLRMILFYRIQFQNVLDRSDEYLQNLEELVRKKSIPESSWRNYITVNWILGHYFNKGQRKTRRKKASDLLSNTHIEIREGLDIYEEYMETYYSQKYITSTMSNIRKFLDFLFKEYPAIDKYELIENDHVVNFVDYQKNVINQNNTKNSNATINERVRALNRMFDYFTDNEIYDIKDNVITKYELLYEPVKFPAYYTEKEILKLIEVILDHECAEDEIQLKLGLAIMIDTGRRQSEVICLEYDCLKDNKIYFSAIKHNDSKWIEVSDNTVYAVRKLQSLVSGIKTKLYSGMDNRTSRRLFVSLSQHGNAIISPVTFSDYFDKIQIENNLTKNNDEAKYTLHDIKRSFVTTMYNAGYPVEEVARYLEQTPNSLLPYEVNNKLAVQTLKRVEEKGLLRGRHYMDDLDKIQPKLISKLKDINLIERHRYNLIYKENNPKESLPLYLGYCTDNNNYEVCGDLICLLCEEFYADSIEEFEQYALRILKHLYKYRRHHHTKKIIKKAIKALEFTFNNNDELLKAGDFKSVINKIKRQVRKGTDDNEERN